MFQNPNTIWIEIVVLLAVISFLLFLFIRYFYRKKNGLPTGECACCSKKGKGLIKAYHKTYKKNRNWHKSVSFFICAIIIGIRRKEDEIC